MINIEALRKLVEAKLEGGDYYLVDLMVSASNEIKVEIDADHSVDVDFCVGLTRFIEENFDRDVEDYELEVGSAGLTAPFKVLRQYKKNIGNEVEVFCVADTRKHIGVLVAADEEKFVIEETQMIRKEGDKRKKAYVETLEFKYQDVKSVRYNLKF